MALTNDYEEAIQILREPFWTDRLEVRPGSFNNRDKNQATKAIALVYYDWRVMEDRLDCVVGPANWRAHLVPWGPKLICELTILGVTKESSGEEESKKENVGTATEAQCKKRAASSHGIGRYLYFVKDIWGELNKYKNGFEDPDALIRQIYHESRNVVGRSIDFPYDLTKYIGSPGRVKPSVQHQPPTENTMPPIEIAADSPATSEQLATIGRLATVARRRITRPATYGEAKKLIEELQRPA